MLQQMPLSKSGQKFAAAFAMASDQFCMMCRMVETVVSQLGGLHIAVNNAGINKNSAAEDTTEQDWDLTFDLNTKGVFLCCQVGKHAHAHAMYANTWARMLCVAFKLCTLLYKRQHQQQL